MVHINTCNNTKKEVSLHSFIETEAKSYADPPQYVTIYINGICKTMENNLL